MSDLGEEIVKQYIARVQGDKKLREIARTIRNGGGYADAEQYAVRAGEVLSEVFRENITADNFPVGSVNDIYQLIAPSIKMNYEANSQAVALVQKHLNTEGGIGMNPIPTQYDDNATMNIVGRMAKYESYEDAEFMLDQPMVTNSLGTVDKALRENADFQYKSGLKPKIVRTCEPDACEWCQELEGVYDYDEVKDRNNPVFQRHNNCACEITYEPGDGKVQDVVSRDWLDKDAAEERKQVAKRLEHKQIMLDSTNRNTRVIRAITDELYEKRLKEYTTIHCTSKDVELEKTIDPELLDAIKRAKRTDHLRNIFESDEISLKAPIFFDSSFSDLPFTAQKEVCLGIAYMNSFLGISNSKVKVYSAKMRDLGDTTPHPDGSLDVTFSRSLNGNNAFITAIHEYAHVYDFRKGKVSEDWIPYIFNSMLGIEKNDEVDIREKIMPFDITETDKLMNDMELLAYSMEIIVANKIDDYSSETKKFLISLKEMIEG